MKQYCLYIFIFILLLLSNNNICYAQDFISNYEQNFNISNNHVDSISKENIHLSFDSYDITSSYKKSSNIDFSLSGLRLMADSGSLLHDVEFYASIVPKEETALLDNLMTNVTAGCYAYRLLPHGVHFEESAILEVAYEPLAIPQGFHPEDIHTYYYDIDKKSWQQLQRIKVDTIHQVIVSSTNHFTDFINAVIRTPDMPEVKAYVPTEMTDIETPHPFANKVIIETPTANTYGSADISYPIAIPSGRDGLQPNIDLLYSTNNGPSVLGYGWSFQQPAITIDTRWGVPRYDTNYETELYTLNGTQIIQKDNNKNLTLQYQTHVQLRRGKGDVSFVSRNIKNHDIIVRHGDSPQKYWWSVTDKDGVIYYYGKYHSDSGVNESCILTDDKGNIAHWALAEVIDLNGNYIKYEYEKSEGNEIYMTYIYYTGHYDTQGEIDLLPPYRIRMHYDDFQLYDNLQTDCRLGFVRKLDRKICYIDESYIIKNTDSTFYKPYIRYYFSIYFTSNTNNKEYLYYIAKFRMPKKGEECDYLIQMLGEDHCAVPMDCDNNDSLLINRTSFEYHTVGELFDSEEHIIEDTATDYKHLSENNSIDWGVGGTLTVGLGPDVWTTNISAGGNYNFSKSKGDVRMLLMDINGDGLTDKVYIKNDSIYYRKQEFINNNSFFSTEQNTGIPAKSLNHEVSKTNSWGLQAGAAAPGEIAGANISGGWSLTNTQVSSFFADVNGDGLPDYIDNGTVYFNRLNSYTNFYKHNHERQIVIDSTKCSSNFYYDGQVNANINSTIVDSVLIGSFTANTTKPSYNYIGDCAVLCQDYLQGTYELKDFCEECLQTTPVYLLISKYDNEYQIIPNTKGDFCSDPYNSIYYFDGIYDFYELSRLCPECLDYLEEYSFDKEAYIECASSCQQEDSLLYWYYNGCCYNADECPTETCWEYAKDVRDDCEYGCVNGNEVCEDCIERCANGDAYDCNECKREYGCNEAINDEYIFEICYAENNNYFNCNCINELYDSGLICEECLETCLFHPGLCRKCMYWNCPYLSPEDIAELQIYQWERRMRNLHRHATFKRDGWTISAYDTVAVCLSPEEEIAPNIEAVRVWVAPQDGTIRIKSEIQLLKDNGKERFQSRSADGVSCIIQHDKQIHIESTPMEHLIPDDTEIIDITNIFANDYSPRSKEYYNIVVHKGDILSFHLFSKSTHVFDNVDWKQHIYYYNLGDSFHSDREYICCSKDNFQHDAAGNASIEFWADVQIGGNAILKVLKGNQVHAQYNITSSQNKHNISIIDNIKPDKDNAIYLLLDSSNPNRVQVRAKLTFNYGDNLENTIVKWLVPEVCITRTPNETLDDVYYDLFGPLYRGWGQYAFNNKYASTVIPLDSLFNPYQHTYETVHNDTSSYRSSIVSIAEMDTVQIMTNPNCLEDAFSTNNLYNPLSHMWIEMSADAENYQWEAYGKVARVGQTFISNARQESQLAKSSDATSTNEDNFEFYDNAVPKSNPGTRVMTVRKESKTKQWNVSFGANIGGVGIGRSKSNGTYKLLTDFMDMNGDRYPDIVTENAVQYTKPWGGLGETRDLDACLHETLTITEGASFSGNFAKTIKQPGGVKNNQFMTSVSGGTNVGKAYGYSEASFIMLDVNNDGLPDKLMVVGDSTYIYLNIGYNFVFDRVIELKCLNKTYNESTSGDVGFSSANNWGDAVKKLLTGNNATNNKSSKYQASISAGCSASVSSNTTQNRLLDINGDGRLDLIQIDNRHPYLYVDFNILDYSGYNTPWVTNSTIKQSNIIQYSKSNNAGLNIGLTGGYSFLGILKVCGGAQTTPVNISETIGTHDMIDMNGDGLPDMVRIVDNKLHVRYNKSGKQGLLKSVKNITGNHIELDYTLSPPSTEQPHRQMLLTSVKNIDDSASIKRIGIPIIEKRFIYSDPHYDTEERQSYGYGCVSTYDMYPATDDDTARIYRKHIQRFQNQEFAEHGKLIYEALTDSIDNLYTEYELGTIYYDTKGDTIDNICQDTKIRVGKEAHYKRYYEGTDDPITTVKIYEYDKYDNVIKYENIGDTTIEEDNLIANITYETGNQYLNKNLISLPTELLVNAGGQDIQLMKSKYTLQGKLSKYSITSLVNTNDSAVTEYTYDNYGLLSQVTLPPNLNNQRGFITVKYDALTHSLPNKITNQFGQSQQYNYSIQWQQPLSVKDPAGNQISYKYDDYGRLISITAPKESEKDTFSIMYNYGIINYRTKELYVDTKTYSEGDATEQKYIYDQRGLLCQIKKYHSSSHLITHHKIYDDFGRIRKIGTPTRNYKPHVLLSPPDPMRYSKLLATYTYDICDRLTSVKWNDEQHTTSTTQYLLGDDFWGVKRLKTIQTDENGHQWQTFSTPQGWTTTTIAPDNATTRFIYDALGQLISTTDPDGLTTSYTYNGLGQKTQRQHPDAGTTRWQYDPAGNITAIQTQSQINAGRKTAYHYTYNRLDSICFPEHPEMNIFYDYDSISGRLSKQTDISGYEKFEYDALGNVVSSERLMTMPQETKAYKFITGYDYDSFGKIKQIIYPDNENVSYHYFCGLLDKISGFNTIATDTNTYSYINDISYNFYDKYTGIRWGNGYVTSYSYDQVRQWMTKQSVSNETYTILDIDYEYDAVGNINGIDQTAGRPTWFGGPYTMLYEYDTQNRLTKADMVSDYFGEYSDYTMNYSPSGLVGLKSCNDMLWNYWYGYSTNSNGTLLNHQVRSIYDMENDETAFLQWDTDGQLQNILRPCSGDMRHHWWNEAGQMVAFVDNERCGYYGYDGNGERIYKLTGQSVVDQYNAGEQNFQMFLNDAVLYVNPYMVVTPKGYTKHYYNGSQHIAAQIGKLEDLPNDIIDTSAVAMERIANARAYMDAILNISEIQPIDTTSVFADIEGDVLDELQWQCNDEEWTLNTTVHCDSNLLYPILTKDTTNLDKRVSGIYYYHPDHLGSATWITNASGNPVQFIHYMPWGELWYNQQASAYNERFKFTGKERDTETGYDYFGARYYSSALPMWLSVDPLSDQYPNISPYAYCNWNPVKYVDPDGKEKKILLNKSEAYAANNFKDDSGIYIFGHGNGSKNYIKNLPNQEPKEMAASDLADFITTESSQWEKDVANGDVSMIFLYACHAGEGDNSVAQDLSLELSDYGSFVIAPIGILESSSDPRYPKDGKYQGVKNNRGQEGTWGVYKNGKLETTIRGNKNPTKATVKCKLFLDNLWQSIKNFFSYENE